MSFKSTVSVNRHNFLLAFTHKINALRVQVSVTVILKLMVFLVLYCLMTHITTLKYNFSPVPEAELNEVVLQLHSVICVLTTTFMVYLWLGGYVSPCSSNSILAKFFINLLVLQIPCNFAGLLSAMFFNK